MIFAYDPVKSATNAKKHGIDFIEGQALWQDDNRLEIPSRIASDEERWVVIGQIGDRLWTAVVTYRGDTIRLISVRRARDNEPEDYHG